MDEVESETSCSTVERFEELLDSVANNDDTLVPILCSVIERGQVEEFKESLDREISFWDKEILKQLSRVEPSKVRILSKDILSVESITKYMNKKERVLLSTTEHLNKSTQHLHTACEVFIEEH